MARRIQSDEHVALGRSVRTLRNRRGYSQHALGQRTGIHPNYIGAIERGEVNPSFGLLLRLADGLSARLSELLVMYEVSGDSPSSQR
jgi:transcriptional regulator with XRE-family HTH domain